MKTYEVIINFKNENVEKIFEAESPDDAAEEAFKLMKKCAYAVWKAEKPFGFNKFLSNLDNMLEDLRIVSIKETS